MKSALRKIRIISILMLMFSGCASLNFSCPCSLENISSGRSGEGNDLCVYMEFYNDSPEEITDFTVSLLLCDSSGDEDSDSFIEYCETVECSICAFSSAGVRICAEGVFAENPEADYEVYSLYVRNIDYADGKNWSDPSGMYAVRIKGE